MKRGGSLSFLVGTISNVLVMEIGWTDVGSGGYILVSCAHSNTSFFYVNNTSFFFHWHLFFYFISNNNCRLLTTVQVFDIMFDNSAPPSC